MRNKYRFLTVLLIVSVLLTGCGAKKASNDHHSGRLKIFTTIYPLQYFTERIGGKYVEVKNIVPPGADAHSFEPTTRTMMDVATGDAFIYNGTGIEGFANAVKDAIKDENVKVIEAAKGIDLIKASEHEEEGHDDHGDKDPHVWLDPVLAEKIAANIKNELIALKPEEKAEFNKNYQSLKKDLEHLDASFKNTAAKSSKKAFVVSHAAYGYLAKRYGLEQVGVTGLSPSEEPSQKQLEKIIKLVKKEHIHYILFEGNVNNKVASVVEKETGARTLTMRNLESLTKDDVNHHEDYLSLMKKNAIALQTALK
ncbi:metal ABC transporter substrate-binding protein [Fictibacillus gelatini]|uniref:metal ABC transporter substrate-binding protein n=1 Tax=Fictibacillus gelatini TaxID=225985 RepID=UPI000423AA4D|nr:metal ABC transporter substrate-binding protein [Fictibacillus gelatini]